MEIITSNVAFFVKFNKQLSSGGSKWKRLIQIKLNFAPKNITYG